MSAKSKRGRKRKAPASYSSNRPDAATLLDKFSEQNVVSWQRRQKALREYQTRVHFYLAGQRMLVYPRLLECLRAASLADFPFSDHYRVIDLQYSDRPLSPKGSLIRGGRFNYGEDIDPGPFRPFPALYVANDHDTAMHEKFAQSEIDGLTSNELALRNPTSYTCIKLHGELHSVLDLRDAESLRCFAQEIAGFKMPADLKELAKAAGFRPARYLIDTCEALLADLTSPDWRRQPSQYDLPANSQTFGEIAVDAGIGGIAYSSTRAEGVNIAIFVQNMEATGSWCELQDRGPPGIESRLDGANWVSMCG